MNDLADKTSTPLGWIMSLFGLLTFEYVVMFAGLVLTGISIYIKHRHQKKMEGIARERLELERGAD